MKRKEDQDDWPQINFFFFLLKSSNMTEVQPEISM